MKPPLRTILAANSLVICGLSAAACVVSYVRPAGFSYDHTWRDSRGASWGANITCVGVCDGRLFLHSRALMREHPWPSVVDTQVRTFETHAILGNVVPTWRPFWREAGIGHTFAGTDTETPWTLPLPLPVLLFAILPVRWAILRRRERRRDAAKVCVRCGYDLRPCVERCSECGEPIPALA